MESEDSNVSGTPAGVVVETVDCSGSDAGSDLEYTDYESLMSSEDDDNYDFDPIEYFEEMSSMETKRMGVSMVLCVDLCVCLQCMQCMDKSCIHLHRSCA